MALLEPKLCILDETDSGLDIDALKIVADGVNKLRDPKRSFWLLLIINACLIILFLIRYMFFIKDVLLKAEINH